jgi:hypothetical protein
LFRAFVRTTLRSDSTLHARQTAFAHNKNNFGFSSLGSDDVAFPILQSILQICDGFSILWQDTRIQYISVDGLNVDVP